MCWCSNNSFFNCNIKEKFVFGEFLFSTLMLGPFSFWIPWLKPPNLMASPLPANSPLTPTQTPPKLAARSWQCCLAKLHFLTFLTALAQIHLPPVARTWCPWRSQTSTPCTAHWSVDQVSRMTTKMRGPIMWTTKWLVTTTLALPELLQVRVKSQTWHCACVCVRVCECIGDILFISRTVYSRGFITRGRGTK